MLKLFFEGRHVQKLGRTPSGDPLTQKSPFLKPFSDKKGTNLLLFEFCIHLHTHQSQKMICWVDMGQKLRWDALAHMTSKAPTTHLHALILLFFIQHST